MKSNKQDKETDKGILNRLSSLSNSDIIKVVNGYTFKIDEWVIRDSS